MIQEIFVKDEEGIFDLKNDRYQDLAINWLAHLLKECLTAWGKMRGEIESLEDTMSFNISYITKKGDTILIGNLYDDEEREVKVDKQHLLDLVDKWYKLAYETPKEMRPKEIVITREGNRFTIEPLY